MNPMSVALWFFLFYVVLGSIYFCVASYLALLKAHKQALARVKQLEAEIADWEEASEDAQRDYSIMATMIEEHTTQLADVHKWMDKQDVLLDQLGNIHIRIVGAPMTPDYSYCGPDEYENDADPYPEPVALPDWAKETIGSMEDLDEL